MRELGNILPAYNNNVQLVTKEQRAFDIIKLIEGDHNLNSKAYDLISEQFWKDNVKDTAKYLFDYVRKNVFYEVESGSRQTVKTPSAIVAEGKGDCKHMSSFIVGIADSLRRKGYPIQAGYMYVNNADNTKNYHHVFAVLQDPETKQFYWVDPIPHTYFNEPKKYLAKKYSPMPLYRISGNAVAGQVGKRAKKTRAERKQAKQANAQARKSNKAGRRAERKKVKAMPKAERKAYKKAKQQDKKQQRNAVKKVVRPGDKIAHVAMKIPNAISRNAFLGLLKLNFARMAGKVGEKVAKDPAFKQDLQRAWYAAGGDWLKVRQALNQGINVHNKKFKATVAQIGSMDQIVKYDYSAMYNMKPLQPWQEHMCNCDSLDQLETKNDTLGARIGEPDTAIAVAAMVAAAMPLIIKLLSLLKRAGVDTDELKEDGDMSAEEVLDEYNDAQEYPLDEDDPENNTGSSTPQFGIKAYNRPGDGVATIEYTKTNLNDNGDVDYNPNFNLDMVADKAGEIWEEYKTPIIGVGVTVLAIKFLPDILAALKGKKRRK